MLVFATVATFPRLVYGLLDLVGLIDFGTWVGSVGLGLVVWVCRWEVGLSVQGSAPMLKRDKSSRQVCNEHRDGTKYTA